jgi:ribonucleoside-diphosphate reductase alpha chain
MERCEKDDIWSLMSPDECPKLNLVYGDEFKQLYESYEQAGKFRKQIKARDLLIKIMDVQIETGGPYMCYKDAANKKNNQKNLGTIESSNLCAEIMEYSSKDETAVCNLASINLTKFADAEKKTFDFEGLRKVAYVAACNLDRVIDSSTYPCPEASKSNSLNRPIGLGVQGIANVLYIMKLPFESQEARDLNNEIFETIYYGAIEASANRAAILGSYSSFEGSPFSEGKLQFDLWEPNFVSSRWDWNKLKEKVKKGMRNSLLTAVMPTASTSQILGNYECIEPPNSKVYVRQTSAGKFIIINKYLVQDLEQINLWDENMSKKIMYYDGSIQDIPEIPKEIKALYKTVWELPQNVLVNLSVDRGRFIDQSQSLNIYMATPDKARLYRCHMYGWKKGLKTGMYYFRSKPATNAIKFGLGTKFIEKEEQNQSNNEDQCEMCSG